MNVEVLNTNGSKVSEMVLSDVIFAGDVKEHLFYEVVKMQRANKRAGTASTKTKGEVSGGGAKPWKQKGTGRARSGSNRSPLWRHGGTVFGPHPRDYSYKVPKKVMKEAIKSALRLKVKEGRFTVLDSIELAEPRTKAAIEVLKKHNLDNALIIIDGANRNLELAVRNLKDFQVQKAGGLNVYDILSYDNLVITRAALEKVEAMVQ
ncbi:MAG TPA: 50S ribosomal protein L4 [Deltaproteobacteria bacterium]|nr:MAG: 50S ribosomal protein L4 [Deltaproteobacteria bacterium GWA2_55_82]OGQ65179.1 MAG: 50S ribosomal protein L4 [Deltaproteobacteria bacterium RIFCSPLOWO2_02_FULL_55_12]OIJ74695.1 MAG: 50S ribosomal protein L4 [Deltaproteobacteria bacterium GWC2_55_46]HBG45616.1 50S ribosomal protein L4 [Deltaproteobacteria bacterium]HCY12191.1 50S ribosomal protein L4 [Deltaproteobacteria bacterium]